MADGTSFPSAIFGPFVRRGLWFGTDRNLRYNWPNFHKSSTGLQTMTNRWQRFTVLVLLSAMGLLGACSPSASSVQFAIERTQSLWTPIPSQTPLPTYTSVPTYTPQPIVQVTVQVFEVVTPTPLPLITDYIQFGQTSRFRDAQGRTVIVGEVSNSGPFPLSGVRVSAQLYDNGGALVGVASERIAHEILLSGEASVFELRIPDPQRLGTVYELSVSEAKLAEITPVAPKPSA